jgi:hypothetical protein
MLEASAGDETGLSGVLAVFDHPLFPVSTRKTALHPAMNQKYE